MNRDEMTRQVWITYAARFNASDRLKRKAQYELWIPPLLSVIILSMNFAQLMKFTELKQTEIGIFTVFGSLLTVVLGLIWGSQYTKLASEKLHQCALAMKAICPRLEFLKENGTDEDFLGYYARYTKLEQEFQINHDVLDYDRVVLWKEKKDELKFWRKTWFYLKYYSRFHLGNQLFLLIPLWIAYWILTK